MRSDYCKSGRPKTLFQRQHSLTWVVGRQEFRIRDVKLKSLVVPNFEHTSGFFFFLTAYQSRCKEHQFMN